MFEYMLPLGCKESVLMFANIQPSRLFSQSQDEFLIALIPCNFLRFIVFPISLLMALLWCDSLSN